VLLGQQGGGPGHVRRRHRRTRGRGVLRVDRVAHGRAGRAGRHDAHAGRGDLWLQAQVSEARAAAGEVGQRIGPVDRADRQRTGGGARGADGGVAALVAGRDDEQSTAGRADLVDGDAHRVGAVGGGTAEAHVDDLGALGHGPLHALDDLRLVAGAAVVEHLADEQLGAVRDALAAAAGGRAAARDRGGHVGAVAEAVDGVLAGAEVAGPGDPAGQIGVAGVDAGVEHGDPDPAAVEPACQAAGAPICAVLRSSTGLTLPSSQMRVAPAVRAVAVCACQKRARVSLAGLTAVAPMLVSARASAVRRAAPPCTISGRVGEAASP
jgi:hypothetical protein